MTSLNEEIYRKLIIYKKNYTEYTRCLIRASEIILDGRHEEKVRQLFLYFLVNESRLFPNTIDIKVEFNNHDIEIYKKSNNEKFQPYKPPIVIVELKREEEILLNHEKQIEGYLKESGSEIGILYNYHQIIAYEKTGNVFNRDYFNSLRDIVPLISQKSNKTDNDILDFEKAVNGNLESFIYLAQKYGKYALNKVVFQIKGEALPIIGCFFRFQDNKVYYDIYSKYSKKQRIIDYQDFEKLVSIIY
ncbi:type I restriction enzyme HsdR N-terminal domain-containing protein [Calothrix sp. FACHB-1219]|uniref:GxxExxY protein n=1 Tax=unclassified Calothrix TaxID=2619626 RepID=UPI001683F4BB|nr:MULTISPECIES: type I restriction enzyme HsdR N-terminal domain-containing protein [unclassified Calothrix]MBD2206266.1 type I restriction enzyme HsdR N-terminal domain-containing protein [Calothrix sp. FACHB-168]MBD2219162.1 type I restriction enzyme HsdR N-terminal domain-containing protein [Calothrix sp. FACHB-1219]